MVRPWGAADGALVRLRLPGGDLPAEGLVRLAALARRYGDGAVHLTTRANVQVRGLPLDDDRLPAEVEAALLGTGLVPSPTHELVRNVLVSPLTGVAGGRADLRPVVRELDRRVCADPALAGLSARFLFVLDDGRGDVAGRRLDLGAVALDEGTAQLRAGSGWGGCVPLDAVPAGLVALAHDFLAARADGPTAPWHVDELAGTLAEQTPDPRALVRSEPLPYGPVPTGVHLPAPDGVLAGGLLDEVIAAAAAGKRLVVTPWRGVLVLEPGCRP